MLKLQQYLVQEQDFFHQNQNNHYDDLHICLYLLEYMCLCRHFPAHSSLYWHNLPQHQS